MKRALPSLRARALTWLAQREQSRSELRRKLMRVARQPLASACASPADEAAIQPPDAVAAADEVERVLDWLETQGLLSEARFVESRVRARAARLGTRRIEIELAQHGLKLGAQPLQQLRDSELQRARQLWRRRFGVVPVEPRERARQARFLAGRGFAADVIRRVLASADDTENEAAT